MQDTLYISRKKWTQRPPASSPGGQVAWDLLSKEYPEFPIVELFYAPEMDDGAWCAKFANGDYHDIDVLVTRHVVNQQKSARMHFNAGRFAVEDDSLEEARALWLSPPTSAADIEQFERGLESELAARIGRVPLLLQTSNERKLKEFLRFGLDIRAEAGADLPEVEGTPEEVVRYKALAVRPGILVEDTSLDVEGFDAGINIRWLLETVTARMKAENALLGPKAVWRVMLAFHCDGVLYSTGAEVTGRMIAEPSNDGFSFDGYFVPDGYSTTLGEMELAGTKDRVSARKAAALNLLGGKCKWVKVATVPPWAGAYQSSGA